MKPRGSAPDRLAAVRGKPGFEGRMGLFEPGEVAQIHDRVARPSLSVWNRLACCPHSRCQGGLGPLPPPLLDHRKHSGDERQGVCAHGGVDLGDGTG